MQAIDEKNHAEAFKTLLLDIEDITKSFQLVLEEVMAKIAERRRFKSYYALIKPTDKCIVKSIVGQKQSSDRGPG